MFTPKEKNLLLSVLAGAELRLGSYPQTEETEKTIQNIKALFKKIGKLNARQSSFYVSLFILIR